VAESPSRVDFALVPAKAPEDFTFVHASDTHIAPASLGRTQRLRTMVDSMRPAFALIAGDLVRDALRVGQPEATSYYDLFMSELGQFKTPAWTVPGNHENFGIEQNLSHVQASNPLFGRKMYHHYLGPDYYSFTYGGVHFVGLNTVDIEGPSYYGHVDSLQLAWLKRDLERIPANMPVVTFDHIPLVSSMEPLGGYTDAPPAPTLITVRGKTVFRHVVSNAAEVLAVLRARPHILALGAHIHAGEKIAFEINGVKTRFEQSPAVVGPSQHGPLTFPSGFTLYTVRKGVVDAGRFVPLS
jgi:3',5'-cyclic AMP phosphodiesterase CpdA